MTTAGLAQIFAACASGAISACDPQSNMTAAAIRRARLSEDTLNASIQQDAQNNEFKTTGPCPTFNLSSIILAVLLFLQLRVNYGHVFFVMSLQGA